MYKHRKFEMWLLITGLMLLTLASSGRTIVAPYQVSIRSTSTAVVGSIHPANNDGLVPAKHICSGIVIRDKYILTTAGCVHVRDPQSGLTRVINPGETFVVAGNVSLAAGTINGTTIVRRNVVSVIPHEAFNATSGEHDIALLKLDRSLPLLQQNSVPTPAMVQWIELQGLPPPPPPPVAAATHNTTNATHGGQTTTVATANNKVNENCFINIYNNSVGPSNYPYTAVRNVSFFDKWICDERSRVKPGSAAATNGRSGRCIEYRFSDARSCFLDPEVLRQSEERGTALVCNFKLAAILAEINPPANPSQCAAMVHRATAYYTPVEPYLGWIVGAIGNLYSAGPGTGVPGGPAGAVPGYAPGMTGPGASWGTQQVAAEGGSAVKPKSATAAPFCGGVWKVILFNLFISFAFVYRFHH